MELNAVFLVNSILLGAGLAMDAFSVSLADGMNEPMMSRRRMVSISGVFAGFQFLMPLMGWLLVHTLAHYFNVFAKLIPWIAFLLLSYIGGKMIYEGLLPHLEKKENTGRGTLFMQGIPTSIDALSVGFTIASYTFMMALIATLLIALTTFVICIVGLRLGRSLGMRLASRANFLGGVILVSIGIEIFLTSHL